MIRHLSYFEEEAFCDHCGSQIPERQNLKGFETIKHDGVTVSKRGQRYDFCDKECFREWDA